MTDVPTERLEDRLLEAAARTTSLLANSRWMPGRAHVEAQRNLLNQAAAALSHRSAPAGEVTEAMVEAADRAYYAEPSGHTFSRKSQMRSALRAALTSNARQIPDTGGEGEAGEALPQFPRPWSYDNHNGDLLDAGGHLIEAIADEHLGRFIVTAANAALRRPAEAAVPAGEPVAWRCERAPGDWRYYTDYGAAHVHELHGGVIAQPLYASPVPATEAGQSRDEVLSDVTGRPYHGDVDGDGWL